MTDDQQAPAQAQEPSRQRPASGRDDLGRFVTGYPGPALKTGEHSRLVRSGIATGGEQALAAARVALRAELGETSIIKTSLADAFVELSAVRDYLGSRLGAEGPLTGKGRTRALLTAYLSVVDRQVRLAQTLGLDRRAKNITETFDAALAQEPEAR